MHKMVSLRAVSICLNDLLWCDPTTGAPLPEVLVEAAVLLMVAIAPVIRSHPNVADCHVLVLKFEQRIQELKGAAYSNGVQALLHSVQELAENGWQLAESCVR